MIEISTKNENEDGFDLEIQFEGKGSLIVNELTAILDRFYKSTPELFTMALLLSQYTADHT